MLRIMFRLKFKDTQAGIKFFKKNVVETINNHKFICRRYSLDFELFLLFKNKKFSIKEVDVSVRYLKRGSLNIFNVFKVFSDLIKLWILDILGCINW